MSLGLVTVVEDSDLLKQKHNGSESKLLENRKGKASIASVPLMYVLWGSGQEWAVKLRVQVFIILPFDLSLLSCLSSHLLYVDPSLFEGGESVREVILVVLCACGFK